MKQTEYQVVVARWPAEAEAIQGIRTEVFIEEQNVPAELEWDGLDDQSTHFIVRHGSRAIATARLKPDGQIGRMAVLKDYRQRGVGSVLLSAVLAHATGIGRTEVYLHAQVQVIGFYQKHGFIAKGGEFIDAGIPHREMYKNLC